MRRPILTLSLLVASTLLTACGQAGAPTATLSAIEGPAASPVARAAAVQPAPTARVIANGAGSIIAPNAARVAPVDPATLPALDMAYAEPNPPGTPAEEAAEDARLAAAAAEEPPAYNVDDRMPYGVVVTRTATTATVHWRTNVPTKGLIEFAKTRDFKGNSLFRIDPKGFTDKVLDEVAKTDHKYTLTGLSRFTAYTFKVTAVTPLGLKFAEQERTFRTKFWALR